MKVRHLFISEYKNLRNFSIDFDGASFLEVIVGKNGSGKSNFFEAVAELFRHLYEFDTPGSSPPVFDYRVVFENRGTVYDVAWTSGRLTVAGEVTQDLNDVLLPDNIVLYYSGHNRAISNIATPYDQRFKTSIGQRVDGGRRFVVIDGTYKDLLLCLTLFGQGDSKARTLAFERLGIASVGRELRLVFRRPLYARRSRFRIDADTERNRYWRPRGRTKTFLERLHRCISSPDDGRVRSEGYFPADGDRIEEYVLYLDLDLYTAEFQEATAQYLFRAFDNLKDLELLHEISLELTLKDGTTASTADFSDGQFQSLYIYAIAEFFKDRQYLALLDEPDSFLHPEWQFTFLNQVNDLSLDAFVNGHVLMSSHSAVTLIPYENGKVIFFDAEGRSLRSYRLPKGVAINRLSSDLIKYSEREQVLSIINTISIERKPVLFTEGSTDPIILKVAWQKLYDEEMPFIPFYAFSCTYINQLLTDDRIHREMGGLPVFALFDFDKAYDQWNGLNGEQVRGDPDLGLVKKWRHGESYAIMLPVPPHPEIRSQVIKDEATKETFGGASHCEIEHHFYGSAVAHAYFEQRPAVGGRIVSFKSDADKTHFARDVVPRIEHQYFEGFRPLFEYLKSMCRDRPLVER